MAHRLHGRSQPQMEGGESQFMKLFNMQRLSFGAICPAGDVNFPPAREATGHLDIDGDMPRICRRAGLEPGRVAIDIGAFVGDTAVAMAEFGAEVYAFEPFFLIPSWRPSSTRRSGGRPDSRAVRASTFTMRRSEMANG